MVKQNVEGDDIDEEEDYDTLHAGLDLNDQSNVRLEIASGQTVPS